MKKQTGCTCTGAGQWGPCGWNCWSGSNAHRLVEITWMKASVKIPNWQQDWFDSGATPRFGRNRATV